MAVLPAFKALLKKTLTDDECRTVVKEIRATPGVLGATFNKKSREVRVTHNPGSGISQKIARIDGVGAIREPKQ
jgi:hypothetical protein